MRINMDILKGINYEEGKKILEENGYYESGTGAPDGVEADNIEIGGHFWTDTYYTFEDEDGNEHIISFAQKWEKGESMENDKLICEHWTEVTE